MSITNTYARADYRNQYDSTDKDSRKIQEKTDGRLRQLANGDRRGIDHRLREIDDEWDIERLIQIQGGAYALKFLLFGAIINKKYFLGTALFGALMLQQSKKGWSPAWPLFRKLGKRTAAEINEERHILKALRGDEN